MDYVWAHPGAQRAAACCDGIAASRPSKETPYERNCSGSKPSATFVITRMAAAQVVRQITDRLCDGSAEELLPAMVDYGAVDRRELDGRQSC
jgi:hypothetical protein